MSYKQMPPAFSSQSVCEGAFSSLAPRKNNAACTFFVISARNSGVRTNNEQFSSQCNCKTARSLLLLVVKNNGLMAHRLYVYTTGKEIIRKTRMGLDRHFERLSNS